MTPSARCSDRVTLEGWFSSSSANVRCRVYDIKIHNCLLMFRPLMILCTLFLSRLKSFIRSLYIFVFLCVQIAAHTRGDQLPVQTNNALKQVDLRIYQGRGQKRKRNVNQKFGVRIGFGIVVILLLYSLSSAFAVIWFCVTFRCDHAKGCL